MYCSSVFVIVKSTQVGVMETKMLVTRAVMKMRMRKSERNVRSQSSMKRVDHQFVPAQMNSHEVSKFFTLIDLV